MTCKLYLLDPCAPIIYVITLVVLHFILANQGAYRTNGQVYFEHFLKYPCRRIAFFSSSRFYNLISETQNYNTPAALYLRFPEPRRINT